jgi:hypothetical protein
MHIRIEIIARRSVCGIAAVNAQKYARNARSDMSMST